MEQPTKEQYQLLTNILYRAMMDVFSNMSIEELKKIDWLTYNDIDIDIPLTELED